MIRPRPIVQVSGKSEPEKSQAEKFSVFAAIARRHFIDPVKKVGKIYGFCARKLRKAAQVARKSVASAFEPSFSDPGWKQWAISEKIVKTRKLKNEGNFSLPFGREKAREKLGNWRSSGFVAFLKTF